MVSESDIDCLPAELLTEIFSYLELNDSLAARSTCGRWRGLYRDQGLGAVVGVVSAELRLVSVLAGWHDDWWLRVKIVSRSGGVLFDKNFNPSTAGEKAAAALRQLCGGTLRQLAVSILLRRSYGNNYGGDACWFGQPSPYEFLRRLLADHVSLGPGRRCSPTDVSVDWAGDEIFSPSELIQQCCSSSSRSLSVSSLVPLGDFSLDVRQLSSLIELRLYGLSVCCWAVGWLAGALNQLGQRLERLEIAYFEPLRLLQHSNELVLRRLGHLKVGVYEVVSNSLSLLGELALLTPNLEALQVDKLCGDVTNVDKLLRRKPDSLLNYKNFVYGCVKLRHLDLRSVHYTVVSKSNVDFSVEAAQRCFGSASRLTIMDGSEEPTNSSLFWGELKPWNVWVTLTPSTMIKGNVDVLTDVEQVKRAKQKFQNVWAYPLRRD